MDAVKEGVDHAKESTPPGIDIVFVELVAQISAARAARRAVEMYEEKLKEVTPGAQDGCKTIPD
jgi:hypothetical protein